MNPAADLTLEIPRPGRVYPSVPPEAPPANPPANSPGAPAPPTMIYVQQPPKWAYKLIERNLVAEQMPREDELNALGVEGWELTATLVSGQTATFYFKRLAK